MALQVIQFGGRYFVEVKLVFGSRSSPGNYDDLSDTVLDMAVWESQHPRHLTTKHLDDCLGVGMPGPDSTVSKCFKAYLQLAKRVGVHLLEPDVDKSKLQSPATSVVALGMEFNTVEWEVRCPEGKLGRLLYALRCMMASGVTTAGELASLTGQIVDKAFLLEGGRFNIGAVIQQNTACADEKKETEVLLLPQTREQLRWWFLHLQASAWYCPIRHPGAKTAVPVGARQVWSDAAGGNLLNLRGGVGALLPDGSWVWFPWPLWLHAGMKGSEGYALNSQLQLLELVGPLLALATAPELFRNQAVEYRTDNQSAVFTWRKGYSKEPFSTTVVKAVFDLSVALNSRPYITKVARCSTVGALAADHISKRLAGVLPVLPGISHVRAAHPGEAAPVADLAHRGHGAWGGHRHGDQEGRRGRALVTRLHWNTFISLDLFLVFEIFASEICCWDLFLDLFLGDFLPRFISELRRTAAAARSAAEAAAARLAPQHGALATSVRLVAGRPNLWQYVG